MNYETYCSICEYVGFGGEQAARLRRLRDGLSTRFTAIVSDFYATIRRHPDAYEVIVGGREQEKRLEESLLVWLESVFSGQYDEAYVQKHSRIGRVHVEIGLPHHFMFSAVNRIRAGLVQALREAHANVSTQDEDAIHAILDLELAVMLDTYQQESSRRIRMGIDQASAQSRLLREYELISQKLRESEARTRAIIDGVPAFVAASDEEGKISFWNRRLELVTGYGADEMIGRSAESVLGLEATARLSLKNGGHRLAQWQYTRVRRDDGAESVYALGLDVTEEAELARRTARAERLAAVGTLAAGLAHEVRNPLNSASLQLQILRRRISKRRAPEELAPIVERVEEEIRRLDGLVGEFLAFARPGALQLADTDLNELLRDVIELLSPELAAARVEVAVELAPKLGRLRLDSGQIQQVVHNLLRNALQAMTDGGTLRVCTIPADDRAEVTLEIHDTGPGFPPQAPIFDAFYTTKAGGTGLGLAIVHRIIVEHGGTISADSQPGGTVFRIRLPQPQSD